MKEEKLYLTNTAYKEVLLINELLKIIKLKGGSAVCDEKFIFDHNYVIENRTFNEIIFNIENDISKIKKCIEKSEDKKRNEYREKILLKRIKELEYYKNMKKHCPILKVKHTTYLSFVFDGYYYRLSFDENPFFNHLFTKIPCKNNTYKPNYYTSEIDREKIDLIDWLYEKDIAGVKEKANEIFSYLINADISEQYNDYKKIRVYNTYDSGFHYEKIYEKYNDIKVVEVE